MHYIMGQPTSWKPKATLQQALLLQLLLFLEGSSRFYDNIDRGVYDLSNDKSGIRVGNE